MVEVSSFLIGGTHSGSGKTTISLGIMAALRNRGLRVQPFKCGPDFIDPTLHKMVTGRVSRNLDLRMCGASWCKETFTREVVNSDVGIVEGVMGLFDGGQASSSALATTLSIPVVLVVDVRSAAESVAAVVKGFETFDPDLDVVGVIFNRVGSKRHEQLIRDSVVGNCRSRILGFLPREAEFTIAERHLGLHMGEESPLDDNALKQLTDTIEDCIDLDYLLANKKTIDVAKVAKRDCAVAKGRKLRLGVARDKAFNFYYEDNFDLFKQNGFELHFFSPLTDKTLPADLDMLYFGGGYPELYGAQLSENETMLADIRKYSDNGGFIHSECGGFMYLSEKIVDREGQEYPMVGVFPLAVKMRARLSRLGYREVTFTGNCPLGKKGEKLYGHEFHYSEIINISSKIEKIYHLQDGTCEGYRVNNALGGYLHVHFGRGRKNLQQLYENIVKSREN